MEDEARTKLDKTLLTIVKIVAVIAGSAAALSFAALFANVALQSWLGKL
jgi:hypothetical protein